MSQPQPQPSPVTVLCPECGSLIEVQDVANLIRALHLKNECSISGLLATQPE
jgi:hypothetical protein